MAYRLPGPRSRQELLDYCLRRLGFPVIDIDVDPDQCQDRLDDSLSFFGDYHFDASEHLYFPHMLTQDDVDNQRILLPPHIITVTRIIPLQNTANSLTMFDVRYQMRLNDLYTFTSTSVIHYDMMMKHLALLEFEFNPERAIRFNRHKQATGPDGTPWGVLHVELDWTEDVQVGQYIVIECYGVLDPEANNDVYNDRFLKAYATALIKRQWGANLSKFSGVAMLGGVTLNGNDIFNQANEEIKQLEEDIDNRFSLPVDFMMG